MVPDYVCSSMRALVNHFGKQLLEMIQKSNFQIERPNSVTCLPPTLDLSKQVDTVPKERVK